MRWPPVDERIGKFEADLWLNSCGIDYKQVWRIDKDVERAVRWINKMLLNNNE